MKSATTLIGFVRQLIEAENERDRTKAERILSQDFTAITRARGEEQLREPLLEEIAAPKNPNLLRQLDEHEFREWESGEIGVTRSLVTTTDPTNPQTSPGTFRNIHVFQKQEGLWRCIAWQVTKVDPIVKTEK